MESTMKKLMTFLQGLVIVFGLVVLALLFIEPQLEGRNVHATLFEIYFKDPFLAYIYLAFVPFFVGLYQVFKFLGYIGQGKLFTFSSAKALRTVKRCAVVHIALIAGAEAYLFIVQLNISDDIAGGVAMGLLITLVSVVIFFAATVFEKRVTHSPNLSQ